MEGERVTLQVNFTGSPSPAIKWTFNNVAMQGDYATELGTDGSLVFYCVEPKHNGKYVTVYSLDYLGTCSSHHSL